MKKPAFLGTAALVALSIAAPAAASPITPIQITDWPAPDVASNGGNTAIASDPTSGNSVIVYGYTDGVASYFTQLVNAAGIPVGPAHRLTNNSRPFWAQPSIAWNPSTGGYLSCWGNYTGSTPVDIKCDALAADGTPAGSPSTITSTPDEFNMTNLAWSTAKGKFLVTMTDWADYARASFVDSSGAPSGPVIDFMPDSAYDFQGGAGLAYSPTSNRFLVYARAKTDGTTEAEAPWLWLIDGDGNPVSSPQRIDPDTTVEFKNASIAWNSVRDEFVVMSVKRATDPEYYIRRFKASDGSPVGDASTATVSSSTFDPAWDRRFRPQLSANAFADQLLAYVALDTNTAGGTADFGIYAMSVAGDGTMGAPQAVAGGTSAYLTSTRPWLTFNPYSCEYLGDYSAKDTAATGRFQLYTVRYTQPEPCKVDLTLGKAGTGSGTVSGTATESQMGLGSKAVSEGTTNLYRSYKVSLTAAAASGSTFTGWSGSCSGTGTCEVTMSEARSVTANFATDRPAGRLKVRTPRLVGSQIRTWVWEPGAGVIRQAGTFRYRGKTRVACRAGTRRSKIAGVYRYRCRLTDVAKSARRKGTVRVRLATTFTPASGSRQVVTRTVTLRSLKPKFTG